MSCEGQEHYFLSRIISTCLSHLSSGWNQRRHYDSTFWYVRQLMRYVSHFPTFCHPSLTATWRRSLRHFCSVLIYLTYLHLSSLVSCAGCLCFPVPGSMVVLMNSSAISRSSPVYVQATSSSVTDLRFSSSFDALFRFLFFVPRHPLWTASLSGKCRAPSC